MQQDEKQNVSRETLEGSVDMLDIARVAQDVEACEFAGMGSLKLVAPAKVNLYLNVKGVRDDGYHEVSTTMHALMLHDVLRMKIIPGTGEAVKLTTRSFEGLAPLDVDPQDNIVVKAILKLAEAFGRTLGEEETMRVHLEKRIPVQAGLGGGSSDAAAALLGSAVLWGESVLDPRIKEVAAQLGAAEVFFLQGGRALDAGIGGFAVCAPQPRSISMYRWAYSQPESRSPKRSRPNPSWMHCFKIPPSRASRSTSSVFAPARRAPSAAASPAGPPPTITTS